MSERETGRTKLMKRVNKRTEQTAQILDEALALYRDVPGWSLERVCWVHQIDLVFFRKLVRDELGIQPHKAGKPLPFPQEIRERVISLKAEGSTVFQIATELNLSTNHVKTILKQKVRKVPDL